MRYRKRESLQRKIKKERRTSGAEKGQVSWVLGLFMLLFLAILLCMQLQLELYSASAGYLEDALALSNLASAVIDVREYGSTHKVRITDPEQAYDRYCQAVRENLGLNENYEAANYKLISGRVQILSYIIYNAKGQEVSVWERDDSGQIREWQGVLGEVRTPEGQIVEKTGVYSKISYPVEGFLGITVTARKSKLVDIVSDHDGEEIYEETEDESEMESKVEEPGLDREHSGGVSGSRGSICIPIADREKSTCGV